MDPITGLASATSGSSLIESLELLFHVVFSLAITVFIAICWFTIGRRAGAPHAWLAFVPLLSYYVPYRVSRTPPWTFVVVILSTIGALILAGSVIASMVWGFTSLLSDTMPTVSWNWVVTSVVLPVLGALFLGLVNIAITAWWTYRAALELGFSGWVGLLASPLARLIPLAGQIVRLVFLGMLAFRREPL